MSKVRNFIFAATVLLLAGCDSGSDDSTTTTTTATTSGDNAPSVTLCSGSTTGVAGSYNLSGTLTYDSVPIIGTAPSSLNYAGTTQAAIRGANVQLIDCADSSVLDTTNAAADGTYSFTTILTSSVQIVVYAELTTPSVRVEDNTNGNALYGMVTTELDLTGITVADLNAPSGWTGTNVGGGYTESRVAGPFAILDVAYTAITKFNAAGTTNSSFAALRFNWSVSNIASSGDKTIGEITTSHWDGSELYILGKADQDTDEYDTHISAHEWGHYFESKLGRSDSIGGSHGGGDILDPRVAFGEGWGNALSAILIGDAVYRDTYSTRQQNGFSIDMESGANPNPGWFSEASVQQIIYDVFDAAVDGNDTIALGLGPIYDVMVGAQSSTSAFTTIFSFLTELKAANAGSATVINTLTTDKSITAVADEWGTGETNDNGLAMNLPVYTSLTIGAGAVNVTLRGGSSLYNRLKNNRFLTFTGDGSSRSITSYSDAANRDVILKVYKDGVYQGGSDSVTSGTETVTFTTVNAATYTIHIRGFNTTVEDYNIAMQVF